MIGEQKMFVLCALCNLGWILTLSCLANCIFCECLYKLQILDFMLGKGHAVLLRRAELKTFVNFHGNEVLNLVFPAFLVSKLVCIRHFRIKPSSVWTLYKLFWETNDQPVDCVLLLYMPRLWAKFGDGLCNILCCLGWERWGSNS